MFMQDTTWLAPSSVYVELTVKITWIVTLNTTFRTVMKIYRNIPAKYYRPSRSYLNIIIGIQHNLVTGML